MQQQNDWYTGINYFQSYKKQDIQAEEQGLAQPVPLTQYERVELWYVLKGDNDILVNGVLHTARQDSFLCLYAHHLYKVSCVRKPLRVLRIQFYIGLFMHAMWERHPRGRSASLVYEIPACLRCIDSEVLQPFHQAQQESYNNASGSRNMLMYIVLQIHILFCRCALQESMEEEQSPVWKLIKRIVVASREHTTLQDTATKLQLHSRYLNQKIKDACGYSFTQLRSFGKIINTCALLHFEDLSISYIVDLLSYSSTVGFHRQFQAWIGMSPLDYQKHQILDNAHLYCRKDLYLQIMRYLNLYLSQDITLEDMAGEYHRKSCELEQLLKQEYRTSWTQELMAVHVHQAAALLTITKRTITSIAMDCGLSSLAVFERHLATCMGCTPEQYHRQQSV